MGLLREIVENKHTKFAKSADDWKHSVRMSCEVLELDNTVDENYKEEIISCIEQYGPYIVIAPQVAMPHSQENAVGVNKTAISFMKLEESVSFDEGDPEMDAKVFVTLASCDPNVHIDNMSRLSELLSNEKALEKIVAAESDEDLIKIDEEFA